MRHALTAVVMLSVWAPAQAKDLEINNTSCFDCQAAFESVSEDLVAAIDYRAAGPSEATGISGIGVGLVGSYVSVDVKQDWREVTGTNFSGLGVIGLQVTKGLPLGIDAGVFYSTVTGTDASLVGGELRYAFMEGSAVTPAIALRLSHVILSGVDSFDLSATSADLSVSKGFAFVTPYGGVGITTGEVDPKSDPTTNLRKAEPEETKFFVGVRISLGLMEVTPELAQIGDNTVFTLRTGMSL